MSVKQVRQHQGMRQRQVVRDAIIVRDLVQQRSHCNAELIMALVPGPVTRAGAKRLDRAYKHLKQTGHSIIKHSYDRYGNVVLGPTDWGWMALTTDGAVLAAHLRRSNQRNYSEQVNNWRSLRGHCDRHPADVHALYALQDTERSIFTLGQACGKSLAIIGTDLQLVALS